MSISREDKRTLYLSSRGWRHLGDDKWLQPGAKLVTAEEADAHQLQTDALMLTYVLEYGPPAAVAVVAGALGSIWLAQLRAFATSEDGSKLGAKLDEILSTDPVAQEVVRRIRDYARKL